MILAAAGTVISFAELEEHANRLAHFGRAAGLREGDTVAAILENNEHVHAVMWAARRSNTRPRKALAWKTPGEALDELLSQPFKPPGVASTA